MTACLNLSRTRLTLVLRLWSGTQDLRLSPELRTADRNSAGEHRAIQGEGEGTLGRSPESHQQRTEESMGKLYPRLVGILPTGRGQGADLSAGRLDTTAHPEVFLVAVAQPKGT